MNDEFTLKFAIERIVGILISADLSNEEKIEQSFCAAKCALALHKTHSCESFRKIVEGVYREMEKKVLAEMDREKQK